MDFPTVHQMRLQHAGNARRRLPSRDEQRKAREQIAIAALPEVDHEAFDALDGDKTPAAPPPVNAMRAVRRLLQQYAGRWLDIPDLMRRVPFARSTISIAMQHLRNDPTMRLQCRWQAGHRGGRSLCYRVPKRTQVQEQCA